MLKNLVQSHVKIVFSVLGILSVLVSWLVFELLKGLLPDLIAVIHKWMFQPIEWLFILAPPHEENKLASLGSVLGLSILYSAMLAGMVFIVLFICNKIGGNEIEFQMEVKYCEKELANAIYSLDGSGQSSAIINANAITFMKAFEMEVKTIYGLKPDELCCYWIVPTNNDKQFEVFYLTELKDFDTVRTLLLSSMLQEDCRIADKQVKGRIQNTDIEQFAIVKNFGKFRLGFAVAVYKNDTFTPENMQEFERLTTYMLLLGFVTKFVNKVKTLKRAS
ncbi:hypothetical protein E8L90_26800 [Brevibacillus antibioticus]|uniref:Uncharacterized protein n=1 Tax=Brevibacillus antibioticus TaxID=2570228 RepID=A0A4U2YCY1_9BACL|nr:hypothetical protein [Brevibacillus antibioticus]TKI58717.1 hypothetical protein E8L90_26800 [Brevibacillus antibioticus]